MGVSGHKSAHPMSRSKKTLLISLVIFIGVIILLSVIYHRTALWEPEQQLITLLPKSPICYLTLKELKGLVDTFNRSEFGKQTAKMPFLAEIKAQRWWKEFVSQKQLWEYEMGGTLDLKTITGYFGEETALAIYQREGAFTFLLITAVGAQEKLSIEALTATDAINPQYKRLQTEYREFTINTIIGYPRNFSYTFIGKIGILSLDPLLLAETIDIYTDSAGTKEPSKSQNFIAEHPMRDKIQHVYQQDKSTGYVDLKRVAPMLDNLTADALLKQIYDLFGDAESWIFSHRYEDGVIISRHQHSKNVGANRYKPPIVTGNHKDSSYVHFPERTAFVATFPIPNQLRELFGDMDISQILGSDLTVLLVAPEPAEVSVVPSLIFTAHAKAPAVFNAVLEIVKAGKISIAGKRLEFLEPQDYRGVTVQPLQLRLNFLMAVTGGWAIVNDHFVLSTTLTGLKSMIDTAIGNTPALTDVNFSAAASDVQAFMQPDLFVPELKRFLPLATTLVALSGQELDAAVTQRITENLFPLESLGPISAEVNFDERFVNAEVRIVLER